MNLKHSIKVSILIKYTLSRQSKSLVMGIWDIIDLIDSNSNLVDIESGKEEEYVIPVGGVKAGLGQKFVVLFKN